MPNIEAPWHAKYPEPQSKPRFVSKDDVLKMLRSDDRLGRDFLLVDVRRNDHEVRD